MSALGREREWFSLIQLHKNSGSAQSLTKKMKAQQKIQVIRP